MNQNLGIIIYENAQPMDIIGPWEVFGFWKNILHAPIDLFLIAEDELNVKCINQITLQAHVNFKNCPQLDYLIVPGGPGRLQEVHNENLISFIEKQSAHCKYILSDCTGMFLLHAAGILKNKSATTYWRAMPELKSMTDVQVVEERIVKDGHIWTAGGVTSGIDLALELIAELAGTETAGQVQLLLEYFPNHQILCTPQTAKTLPAYGAEKIQELVLPKYILDAMKQD